MEWVNAPPIWHAQGNTVTVQAASGAHSYFHHGGRVVNIPHVYWQDIVGDFRAQVKVIPGFRKPWDRAGLYVQLKASFIRVCVEATEEEDDRIRWVVHGHHYEREDSVPLHPFPISWLRIDRMGSTFELGYSVDGVEYTVLHQDCIHRNRAAKVGIQVASPMGTSFTCHFDHLEITEHTAGVAQKSPRALDSVSSLT